LFQRISLTETLRRLTRGRHKWSVHRRRRQSAIFGAHKSMAGRGRPAERRYRARDGGAADAVGATGSAMAATHLRSLSPARSSGSGASRFRTVPGQPSIRTAASGSRRQCGLGGCADHAHSGARATADDGPQGSRSETSRSSLQSPSPGPSFARSPPCQPGGSPSPSIDVMQESDQNLGLFWSWQRVDARSCSACPGAIAI
jgi:hypothetical protein